MRHRLLVPGAAALSLLLAIPASAADFTPGAPGVGDTYYPESGNGGYDVSHYDLRLKYQPKTDLLEGTATLLATHHPGSLPLQPGLRPQGQRDPDQRQEGVLRHVRQARTGGHARHAAGEGQADQRRRALRGQALRAEDRRLQRLGPYARRRCGGAGAGRRRVVVPEQRPPHRQGDVRHLGGGPGRHPGAQQRRAGLAVLQAGLDALQLALGQAAGDVSDDAGRRQVRHHHRQDRERPAGDQRRQQGPRRERGLGEGEHRAHHRDHRVAGERLRRLPVQCGGRLCAERAGRVRPGDPDPPVLRQEGLRPRHERVGRGARAGAPVVRRQRLAQGLEGHLDQRGLRCLQPVAVVGEGGRGHRPGAGGLCLRPAPRR